MNTESADGISTALDLPGVQAGPNLDPEATHRTAYGGWFVVLALLWGWLVDGNPPDRFDVIGALIVLAGVAVIAYTPRS